MSVDPSESSKSPGQSESSGSRPEVRTAAGALRGTWEAGVAVFRGIPFAEPPVGSLRFAAPRPARGWDGVREAVAYGPPPPQGGHFGMAALAREAAGEDWLTVNVWTPEPGPGPEPAAGPGAGPDAGLPVMVWVQGGAYTIGMSGLPEYDGGLLARNRVVVVSFNYRVGIEGFGQIEGAPANRGLLDQIAALEWVRENIRAFGGDPERVTVFGQSAGGGSVAALLAMPRAAGLFGRAVVQSAQGTYFSPELAADITGACAAELGLRPTVAELSTVAPARLSAASDAVSDAVGDAVGHAVGTKAAQWAERWGQAAYVPVLFSPVVDGDTLPVTPWQALADGAGRDIALLVGHTRHEQRLLTALNGLLGQVTEEQAAKALRVFGPGPDGARRYRDGFPAANPDELYEMVRSDRLFRMPSLHLAQAQTAAGSRAHVYELTWPAPGMGGVLGACHGLDVPLVFGNLDRGQPALLIGEGPSSEAGPEAGTVVGTAVGTEARGEAEALSARMRAAWTAFATHGDPGWPAYDGEQRLVRLFDAEPAVAAYPEETSRLIWQDHTFSVLPLVGR
ncbi:carboxylesterase family protein [Streptomyces sp. MST-110588]|uniref:carboxylesterase/lipase family protein n=1 Tax=Streptomyces sp. MST-110588 TaxID=2833628 RepID=UPI001F5E01EA|nr:carboxylesterase family protein [Streptomyces sp. MST-110588]UNO42321.1 carboxylesterase family protein [Streptomyces sp. MST-110588]